MNFVTLFIIFFFALNLGAAKASDAPNKVRAAESVASKKAQASTELNKLADAIQKYYNSTKSATFSFEQSYKHPFMAINESSKGKVFFKAKNMLWRYTEPTERQKEFYIAGKKFTYHLIPDAVAYTHDCFEQDTLSASITFLGAQGKLKESFNITAYVGSPPNNALKWLTLIPKEKNAPVKSISLGADAKNGVVKESVVVDQSDGINHFKFADFVLNKPIADKTFIFVPTANTRVQPMPNVQCPSTTALPTPAAKPSLPAKAPSSKLPVPKPSMPTKDPSSMSPSPTTTPKKP